MAEDNAKKKAEEVTDLQEEFDYQKEIEEIERQERELAERRAKKQEELKKRREERERKEKTSSKENRREENRKGKQKREQEKESEWLGEPLEEDAPLPGVAAAASSTRSVQKKKSHKGLAAAAVILMLAAAGGGAFAFKNQADKKAVADFQARVSSFQTEKLDGAVLGSEASYFDDFIKQCQEAIDAGDVSKIKELNAQWPEVEKKLGEAESGKASLDAFIRAANDTLAKYESTDETKKQYDEFRKSLEQAQKDNDYGKIEELQKELTSLETALKAADIKKVQEMKNDVAQLEMDKKYVTDEQKKEMDTYAKKVEDAQADDDYAGAISALKEWQEAAQAVSSSADIQKKADTQQAVSNAAAAQAQVTSQQMQQEASAAAGRAAAEARQQAASSSGSAAASGISPSSFSKSSYDSLTSDYVFPGSNSRYLAKSELQGLSALQLMVARNEIYARRGRKFVDPNLQAYFNSKSWYSGTVEPDDFTVAVFNKYEKANIMLIKEYESSR